MVELTEERERLTRSLVLLLGAAAFALLAGIAFTLEITLLLWSVSPLWTIGILTIVYGVVAALLYWRFKRIQNGPMFSATFDQLRKDCQWCGDSLR